MKSWNTHDMTTGGFLPTPEQVHYSFNKLAHHKQRHPMNDNALNLPTGLGEYSDQDLLAELMHRGVMIMVMNTNTHQKPIN